MQRKTAYELTINKQNSKKKWVSMNNYFCLTLWVSSKVKTILSKLVIDWRIIFIKLYKRN